MVVALLVTGCDLPPDLPVDGKASYAARLNHPNALVAARLKQEPPSYPLRFALLSDTHHPYGDAVFAQIREQLLQLSPRPAFAVVIGDFVDAGTQEEYLGYLDMIDPYPIPIFSVIGNHEQGGTTFEESEQHRKVYGTLFGAEDFSFDYAGSRFIAMNDIVLRRDGLSDAQIKFLEKELASAPPDRYVLMHQPPPVLPAPWGPPPFFNVDAFYSLVERYGVKIVASGHVHEYKHRRVDGVDYVETGGGGGPQAEALQDPADQAILHNFVLCTIEADGTGTVEIIPVADTPRPDSSFTFHFTTTPAKL
jgi:predicted phosphodiesterase